MRWPALSTDTWKVLLSVVALFVATLLATEIWYAPRTLAPGAAGTLGMTYHELPQWGRSRYVIDSLTPESPMRAAGASARDLWIPDRPYDAIRRLEADEPIGLTLVQGGVPRHLTVQTKPDPTPTDAGLFVAGWMLSGLALILGLVIGFRQANGTAYRALALFMVLFTAFSAYQGYRILPAGTAFLVHHLCWNAAFVTLGALILVVAFNYPDDQPRATPLKRRLLRYVVPIWAALAVVGVAEGVAQAIGYHAPLYNSIYVVATCIYLVLSVPVMWSNWRGSSGEMRERHLWILLAFGSLSIAPLGIAVLRELLPDLYSAGPFWRLIRANELLAIILFAYAVLRHRVVSIGFAVNRVMVYSAASIGMLVSFGIVEWLVHHLLMLAGRETSVLLDAAIAVGVFLAFHRIRNAGENLIERLFFHAWHVKEEAFRKFVKEAPFITRPEALLTAFTTALDRFTDGAGHALYRRKSDGDYERVTTTLADAPAHIDADEPLAVALRANQVPTHLSDARSALPGELALPGVHHGQLDGFVLLGAKPNRDTYRPDEIEVLGHAAHQVGLDFRALRMEQLERDVADSQKIIDELRLALRSQSAPLHQPGAMTMSHT
jgi:hypothetical protein